MKLKPAATKASSKAKEVASSAVQPNTLPPKASGAICKDDWPSLRFSISISAMKKSSPMTQEMAG